MSLVLMLRMMMMMMMMLRMMMMMMMLGAAVAQRAVGDLSVPVGLEVAADFSSQSVSLRWASEASDFDVEVFHTELMNVVFNETVAAQTEPETGRRRWAWLSPLPLQCTSHSLRIRARHQQTVSEWTPMQTVLGRDVPERSSAQFYPHDRVVPVGSNMTFCCISSEKGVLRDIRYRGVKMRSTRLSRRTFSITVTDQPPSEDSGTNVVCTSLHFLTGTVVFVGYPPDDSGLVCETRDLTSAECSWEKGRDTHFRKRLHTTRYTLNQRNCSEADSGRGTRCGRGDWLDVWTLVAQNPLGSVRLVDAAPMRERVRLRAAVKMTAVDVKARGARLEWDWPVSAYQTLDMVCQIRLADPYLNSTLNFSGRGLRWAALDALWPDTPYTASVRCGSQHSFWKWGDESATYSFHTEMEPPDSPDVWFWRDDANTGHVLWKPLSARQSHGALKAYEVCELSPDLQRWTTVTLPHTHLSYPIILNRTSDITVSVAALNPAGLSPPTLLVIPDTADPPLSVSQLWPTDGGFGVSWQADAGARGGYVVEWVESSCRGRCSVDWLKVPERNSSVWLKPNPLLAGVRYTLSLFSLRTGPPVLMRRWHGYTQELTPAQAVRDLMASQSGADVLLSWRPVDLESRRGFIRGHNIYLSNATGITLIANVTDPEVNSYRAKGFYLNLYKFVVKPYTSAGEGPGATVAIKLEMEAGMLLFSILLPLLIVFFCLVLISIFCYTKREWVKKSFYPDVPGPKVQGDWTSPRGPLDLKPSPHSLVQIVESPEWESSKESEHVEPDTDSEEPALLRYYNHVVGDGSTSGSSATSDGSAQTQITYMGIQSPASGPAPSEGGGYRPQAPGDAHQQTSWTPESPGAENFSGSLGSPTSITSSHFLLPESSEEKTPSSSTWLQSLLSGRP